MLFLYERKCKMAGVVLVTEFEVSEQAENFSGYIEYIDRDEAKQEKPEPIQDQEISAYLDYMSNEKKTDMILYTKTLHPTLKEIMI